MFRNSVVHKIFSELLQPFRYVGMARVSPYLLVVLMFIFLDFWLAWSTSLPDLSFQHVYLTQKLDKNQSHTGLPVFVEDVMVGEIDELEEDLG